MSTRAIAVVGELDGFLARVSRYPILAPEEETRLALRWRELGDVRAAHTLVASNLRFVVKIAHEYRGYGACLTDLVQEGSVGLMRAVKKFDPRRGCRLIGYAVHWIRAEIHSFLMRTVRSVRLGGARAHRKLFFKLRALKGRLAAEGVADRDEVIDIISKETGVSREAVEEMEQRLCVPELSIDAPFGSTGADPSALLPNDAPTPEDRLATVEDAVDMAARLETAMAALTPREREIISQRYLRETPRRLKEVGEALGVSKQRAHQLERCALSKLRAALDVAA